MRRHDDLRTLHIIDTYVCIVYAYDGKSESIYVLPHMYKEINFVQGDGNPRLTNLDKTTINHWARAFTYVCVCVYDA